MKLVLIGSGRIGEMHARALRDLDCVGSLVIADAEPRRAKELAGRLGVDAAEDVDELYSFGVQGVVVAAATSAHAALVHQALDPEGGDVDTAAALLTFDDGMLATVTTTRYNGAGHDVRLEVCGSDGAMFVGNDEREPLPSAEPDITWPSGDTYRTFVERFGDAYARELWAFTDVAAGRAESPCTAAEALEALLVAEACELSRHEGRTVSLDEVRG